MWFTESAWPPILICSVAAVWLFVGWQTRRRKSFLVGIGAMVVLGVLIYYIELAHVTEREKVEAKVLELAAAVAELDVDKTLTFISANAVDIQAAAQLGMSFVDRIENMRVTDVQITVTANESRATSHFRANANVTIRGTAYHQPTRWNMTWQQEAGEWKIIKAERLHILNGQPIDLLDPGS